MNTLNKRIIELLEGLGSRFDSQDAYELIESSISAGALIEDRKRILRDRTRQLLKGLKNDDGLRAFENVPVVDEDGITSHQWIQPKLMDLEEAEATVQQTAKIAIRICHKANELARRFTKEGHPIQVPFKWLDEESEISV